MNIDKDVAQLNKKITFYSLLDFPAVVALGVGLYSKFGTQNKVLHPIFANSAVENSLIVVGGAIVLFCAFNVIRLHKEKSRIASE